MEAQERLSVLAELPGGSDALAFGYANGLASAHARTAVELAAGPTNFEGVGFFAVAEAKGQNEFAGGKVAGAAAEHLRLRLAASSEFDDCADAIAIRFCATEFDAQTAIRSGGALRFVAEQIHRAAVGGEQQIQTTVVIDVGVGGAAPHAGSSESWAE